jgi:hypothetical protein
MSLRLILATLGVLFAFQAAAPCIGTAEAQNAAAPASNASPPAPAATGKVVGPEARPQAGVPIIIEGPRGKTHAFTDAKGDWSLYNLEPGEYEVKPAVSSAAVSDEPVTFTVKERGVFGRMFGGESAAVATPAIKLNKDFNQ